MTRPAGTAYGLATSLVNGLRRIAAGLVVAFFAYMAMAVLVQVAGRYLFDYSIDWTAETATFAQAWMIFLAAGLAMRDGLHVSVDALTHCLPDAILRALILVVGAACLWFLSQAFVGSLALIDIGRMQTSPVLALPMWIPYLSRPVGLAYFALEFLLALGQRWRDPGRDRTPS